MLHIILFIPPSVGSSECTICLEQLRPPDLCVSLPCCHGFHEGCIVPWLLKNNKCPCCRCARSHMAVPGVHIRSYLFLFVFIIISILPSKARS